MQTILISAQLSSSVLMSEANNPALLLHPVVCFLLFSITIALAKVIENSTMGLLLKPVLCFLL